MTTSEQTAALIAEVDQGVAELVETGFPESAARRLVIGFGTSMLEGVARPIVGDDHTDRVRADTIDALAAHWGIDR